MRDELKLDSQNLLFGSLKLGIGQGPCFMQFPKLPFFLHHAYHCLVENVHNTCPQMFDDLYVCRRRPLLNNKSICCFFAEAMKQTLQIMQAKPRQES